MDYWSDHPYRWRDVYPKSVRMEISRETDRIIEMAWEDRTPFAAIHFQFGLSEGEVIKLMRLHLKRKSFNLWRKRVHSGTSRKHLKKRSEEITRFKCSRQRLISNNKISKR
jgi:uncharacterized protein (TIGR03643 family)